ncbi:MAG: PP0621 family protein [Gallionella sp.]
MSRLIFLFAVVAAVYLILRSFRGNLPPKNGPVAEDMVSCAQCGLHLPRRESVRSDGRDFCSVEHRDAFQK